MTAALEITDLQAWYGESHILHGIDLTVAPGEVVTLLGRNGAGRTTLLRAVMGLTGRRSGAIRIGGVESIGLPTHRIAHLGVGYCPEERGIFASLSAEENLLLPPALANAAGAMSLDDRAMALLDEVDLSGFADTITADLPYGRKRALEIATTLAMEPELMLLDEPTQGMGHEDVHRVTALIKKVSQGRTILMVEHNMNVVSGICDRISVLQRGAMLAEGSYAEVSKNPQVMQAYMGTADGELEAGHA